MTDPRSRSRWRGALRLCPAILGVLVLTVGCERAKGAKQDAPPPPPPQVVVAEVVQRTVPIIRDFTARTDAIPTVEVRARVARRARAGALQGGHRGQAGPDPVRDPARGVRGGARVGARPARQGAGRSHEGPGHLRGGSRSCPAGRAPGRAGQGAAGRQPVPSARRGQGHSPAGPGYLAGPGEGGQRPTSRPPTRRSRTASSFSGPRSSSPRPRCSPRRPP